MKTFIHTLLLLTLSVTAYAEELQFEQTSGNILVEVTYMFNQFYDEEYQAGENQIQPRVISGEEAYNLINEHPSLEDNNREYIQTVLLAEHARAIIMQGESSAGKEINTMFFPLPSNDVDVMEVPEELKPKSGLWFDLSPAFDDDEEPCQTVTVRKERGQDDARTGCYCNRVDVTCCKGYAGCATYYECWSCDGSQKLPKDFLAEKFGVNPLWRNMLPFTEIEPGQFLTNIAFQKPSVLESIQISANNTFERLEILLTNNQHKNKPAKNCSKKVTDKQTS